ncbi:probable carboxylesterase 17 [Solanum tuberosum]|uniref:CXE carboxylesterase n=1 Tax=Solanum tuberosum TaxID=4113 RepID=M1BAQ1_SOLTU|nr:PREDICTED: probable carboxylesterase 17 [Solanum tuberosum]XP_049376228.1 probable carboxylesterase 17 [Solanum stenotomum]
MSIVAEAPGYIQVFSDGSVKRFEPEIATASIEPSNGYMSKDVVIDSSKPILGRMYLPESSVHQHFPVLVYFHGGGFCIGSTTWLGYHVFLGDLSVSSKSIILSVDYRLAPENRLPIAYEDCYSALEWLIKNIEFEPWLKRADLSQLFLSGDSAGGNIVHQVAIQAITSEVFRGRLKGLLPIHPYFGSEKRTELEMDNGSAGGVEMNDMFWRLSLPQGSNRDYFGCNFENAQLSVAEWSQFPAVIVFVAGLDLLKERGVTYAEFLKKKKGVKSHVKVVEAEEQVHVYHVFHPESEATRLLQNQMSDFINSFRK